MLTFVLTAKRPFDMEALFSFFRSYTDQEIIAMLQSKDAKQVCAAENYLFGKYRSLIGQWPFANTLKEKRDREEAYSDAILILIDTVKAGLYEGRATLNTYLRRIYFFKCVTQTRRNATKKNRPVKSDSNSWENLTPEVQDKLNNSIFQQPDRLWDTALEEFRYTNYRCYYILKLHDDLGFSYKEVIDFLQSPTLQLEDDQTFELDTLIEIVEKKQKELNFNNPGTVKNIASECRKALHELSAHLVGKILQPSKTLEP